MHGNPRCPVYLHAELVLYSESASLTNTPFSKHFASRALHLVPTVVVLEDRLDELLLVDLPHGITGDMINHPHDLWDLVVHQPALEGSPHVHRTPRLNDVLIQQDHGSDFVAPFSTGYGHNSGLGDFRQGEDLSLNFQGANFLAAGLDDVGRLPPLDEVHRTLSPRLGARSLGHGSADGDVARLEPRTLAVWIGDEFLGCGGGVAPVFLEDGRPAELNLAGAFAAGGGIGVLAGRDDIAIIVDETRLNTWKGPANTRVDAVSEVEAAAERHAHLRHAVALEEDVAPAEILPGLLHGRRQRRGSRDADAQISGRHGRAGSLLHLRAQQFMRRQQPAVHRRDDGEERDLVLGGGAATVGGEVRRRETLPDGVGVEREGELDGGAGEERGEDGIDGAVDVVQREDVEEVVARCVLPRVHEGASLCRQGGLWQEDAFLFPYGQPVFRSKCMYIGG